MRYLRAYKWEDILEEEVPRTLLSIDLIDKEIKDEKKAMEKAKRRGKR